MIIGFTGNPKWLMGKAEFSLISSPSLWNSSGLILSLWSRPLPSINQPSSIIRESTQSCSPSRRGNGVTLRSPCQLIPSFTLQMQSGLWDSLQLAFTVFMSKRVFAGNTYSTKTFSYFLDATMIMSPDCCIGKPYFLQKRPVSVMTGAILITS